MNPTKINLKLRSWNREAAALRSGAAIFTILLALLCSERVQAQGSLVNGGNHYGIITTNEPSDTWTFDASAGDNIELREGTTNINPFITLYDPDGNVIGSAFDTGQPGSHDARLALQVTNTGTFTVVIQAYYAGQQGTYDLRYIKVPGSFVVPPGDDGGSLTNGANHTGTIGLGDLDVWTFDATNGDNIELREGTTNINPSFTVYDPNGKVVGSAFDNSTPGTRDVELSLQVTNTGTFTVVIQAYYAGQQGTYDLRYIKVPGSFVVPPGDDGGSLTNGGNHNGTIDLGDLDAWTFSAANGDNIELREGTTNINPSFTVYDPNGKVVGSAFDNSTPSTRDVKLSLQVTNTGNFTVVVQANRLGQLGTYDLRYIKVPGAYIVPPGDEGGLIAGGTTNLGVTDWGDEDPWSFIAFKDVAISLNCQKLSGTGSYDPWMQLYGPDGTLLMSAFSSSTATINYTPTNNGNFTLLVSSYNLGNSGTYQLSGTGFSAGLKLGAPALSGTNLSLTLTGGASNVLFVLYGTTNLTQPAAMWTPIFTNRFDQFGGFNYTNSTNPGQRQQFFRLISD
jgi:Bacterial pre-peptidase C-terminal domain